MTRILLQAKFLESKAIDGDDLSIVSINADKQTVPVITTADDGDALKGRSISTAIQPAIFEISDGSENNSGVAL